MPSEQHWNCSCCDSNPTIIEQCVWCWINCAGSRTTLPIKQVTGGKFAADTSQESDELRKVDSLFEPFSTRGLFSIKEFPSTKEPPGIEAYLKCIYHLKVISRRIYHDGYGFSGYRGENCGRKEIYQEFKSCRLPTVKDGVSGKQKLERLLPQEERLSWNPNLFGFKV